MRSEKFDLKKFIESLELPDAEFRLSQTVTIAESDPDIIGAIYDETGPPNLNEEPQMYYIAAVLARDPLQICFSAEMRIEVNNIDEFEPAELLDVVNAINAENWFMLSTVCVKDSDDTGVSVLVYFTVSMPEAVLESGALTVFADTTAHSLCRFLFEIPNILETVYAGMRGDDEDEETESALCTLH